MDACLQKFETSMGSAPTAASSTEHVASTPRRVAHWDSKREKCNNCELIYLKTLSQHSGFCSVDCKSNMAYLQKVNHTIRAMKDAVDERQRLQEQEVHQEPVAPQQGPQQQHVQSFAEFGLETRILDASNVEWSFSAVY
ncbi:hypothetical protein PHYSODRAFT_561576 [Phytophthora sojae]|uniref:Uncharacterized protein n=1 Tax=Phytophthora sojae (strain P6497) TaxID=1094619 RepID=G4ZPQ9_PHYSP|nr:hypothetical protein PHYSODRAFT_561576 [Phytophthora sojae]EGZ15849.1 hypothetical protein PHYSODRAFT_561576 [Phytophthora sojae]|eukprot:XP_009529598.1 hypothetical protein PHYSODRAFT_561576 [Phytophthora sojae]